MGRRTRVRERVAAFEEHGFVPYAAWRDAEARLAAMEYAFVARFLSGQRIVAGSAATWRRLPAWAR